MNPLLIYGAGGFAREVAWLAESCCDEAAAWKVVAFVEDVPANQGRIVNDIPVLSLERALEMHGKCAVAVAVGNPRTRETLADRAVAAGLREVNLIHPRVERSRFVEFGNGTVVCAGNVLTTNIRLGRQVQVNLSCTIGHDAVLEDFVTLAPGVCISGWVRVERGAYIGTGACVINGTEHKPLIIGAGALVGAGACVTVDVPSGVTVVGVPARSRNKKEV